MFWGKSKPAAQRGSGGEASPAAPLLRVHASKPTSHSAVRSGTGSEVHNQPSSYLARPRSQSALKQRSSSLKHSGVAHLAYLHPAEPHATPTFEDATFSNVIQTLISSIRHQLLRILRSGGVMIDSAPAAEIHRKAFPQQVKAEDVEYFTKKRQEASLQRSVSPLVSTGSKVTADSKYESSSLLNLKAEEIRTLRQRSEHLLSVLERESQREKERCLSLMNAKQRQLPVLKWRVAIERAEAADWIMRILNSYNLVSGSAMVEYLQYTVKEQQRIARELEAQDAGVAVEARKGPATFSLSRGVHPYPNAKPRSLHEGALPSEAVAPVARHVSRMTKERGRMSPDDTNSVPLPAMATALLTNREEHLFQEPSLSTVATAPSRTASLPSEGQGRQDTSQMASLSSISTIYGVQQRQPKKQQQRKPKTSSAAAMQREVRSKVKVPGEDEFSTFKYPPKEEYLGPASSVFLHQLKHEYKRADHIPKKGRFSHLIGRYIEE